MNKIACGKCRYYDFVDTKQSPAGDWAWGNCHISIDREPEDEESWEDLSEYFQVTESHFCGRFERGDVVDGIEALADSLTYWNEENLLKEHTASIKDALAGNIEALEDVIYAAIHMGEMTEAEKQAGADI